MGARILRMLSWVSQDFRGLAGTVMGSRDHQGAAIGGRDHQGTVIHEVRSSAIERAARFDAHCHWAFTSNVQAVAQQAENDGLHVLSCTVSPMEYQQHTQQMDSFPQVKVGLGLHPWRFSDVQPTQSSGHQGQSVQQVQPSNQLDQPTNRLNRSVGEAQSASQLGQPLYQPAEQDEFLGLFPSAYFIGEVGLDFGRAHTATRDEQVAFFSRAMREVAVQARRGVGHVVSIHAVAAAGAVMDAADVVCAQEGCCCILHWFSGTSPELTRAIRSGYYFSVGERMLATRRGRAYAQAIPADRLLLETDWPSKPEDSFEYADYRARLVRAAQILADLRGEDILDQIVATSARVLGYGIVKEGRK